jgi:hypothetical protein
MIRLADRGAPQGHLSGGRQVELARSRLRFWEAIIRARRHALGGSEDLRIRSAGIGEKSKRRPNSPHLLPDLLPRHKFGLTGMILTY